MEIKLILEHRNPAVLDKLRSQIRVRDEEILALNSKIKYLELQYGAEIQYNNALCDLLRAHHIPFRHVLEHDYRHGEKPIL